MFEMTAGSEPGVRKIITLPGATTHSNVRPEVDRREVGQVPGDIRRLAARGLEQCLVEIDSHDIEAAARQLAPDAPGAAAGVEHRPDAVRFHEIRLPVHVLAHRGVALILGVVLVARHPVLGKPWVEFVGHVHTPADVGSALM